MDNSNEMEINLKTLLYKALIRWRKAVAWGVVIALLFGLFTAFKAIKVRLSPEDYDKAFSSYTLEYDSWASTETVLNNKLEDLQLAKSRQEEYNRKSALMTIDPKEKYLGSFTLFADTGYVIDPNLTYQTPDQTGRILSAYSNYLYGGELYEYILERTTIVEEQKYLKELVSFEVNSGAATITATAIGKDEKEVNELLGLIRAGIQEKSSVLCASIKDHTLNELSQTLYSVIDLELEDKQKANLAAPETYSKEMGDINEEIATWRKSEAPEFEFSPWEITKNAIKKAILGGVIGLFVVFGYFAVAYVMSSKFEAEKLAGCSGKPTYIVATVTGADVHTVKKEKKTSARWARGLDGWLAKVFAQDGKKLSFEDSCALAAANISRIMDERKDSRLAFVGALDSAVAEAISRNCGVPYAGNILDESKAVEELERYSDVCVIAVEQENTLDDVGRELEELKTWGKNCIGVLVVK